MVTHRILGYLISLALGYWVLTHADKQKNLIKKVGLIIGWAIIAVSVVGPLCLAGSAIVCHSNGGTCSYMSNCPYEKGGMMGGHGMMNGGGMMEDKDKDK